MKKAHAKIDTLMSKMPPDFFFFFFATCVYCCFCVCSGEIGVFLPSWDLLDNLAVTIQHQQVNLKIANGFFPSSCCLCGFIFLSMFCHKLEIVSLDMQKGLGVEEHTGSSQNVPKYDFFSLGISPITNGLLSLGH